MRSNKVKLEFIVVAVIGGIIGLLLHSLINDYLRKLKQTSKAMDINKIDEGSLLLSQYNDAKASLKKSR